MITYEVWFLDKKDEYELFMIEPGQVPEDDRAEKLDITVDAENKHEAAKIVIQWLKESLDILEKTDGLHYTACD